MFGYEPLICKYFPHSLGRLFILLLVSFTVRSLLKFHVFTFAFVPLAWGRPGSKGVLPMFSSRRLIVSGITFRSLVHFEFTSVIYCVRKCSSFILLHKLSNLSNTTYWRDCLLLIAYSCLLCCRLNDHMHGFYSWALSSVPLICYLCLCQYHTVLIMVALFYSLKLGSMIPSAMFFSSQDYFGYSVSFVVPYKF